MEFFVESTVFKDAALNAARLISKKSAHPALASIKMEATYEGVTFIAGNSILTLKRYLPSRENGNRNFHVVKPGSILISPTYFVEILKKLPMNIHLKVNKNFQLLIESESIKTTLSGTDPVAYPKLSTVEHGDIMQIHADSLKQTIVQTLFAVSRNDGNPALTGVNWVFDEQTWYAIATNSQRLVLVKQPKKENTIEGSYVIPAKVLSECLHILKNDNEITVTFSDRLILFQGDNIEIYSSPISSSFPDVKKLIPTETKTEIIVEKTKLLKGIERMSLLAAAKKNRNVSLTIETNDTIILRSNAGEVGGIVEKQSVTYLTGDAGLQIIFDGQYMKESLGVIKEESIKLTFAGPFRPIRIEPVDGNSFLHLISPLRG